MLWATLRNRVKNEVLPLPLLYALQDESVENELRKLLENRRSKVKIERIAKLALCTRQVQALKKEMATIVQDEIVALEALQTNKSLFKLLLRLPPHLTEAATKI
jgi:hypothetical protein